MQIACIPPALTLNMAQSSMSENGGVSVATVTRFPGTGTLVVNLTSSDTTEATIPSSVTIPNGSTSSSFNVTALDDNLVDGDQTVTITASASGHTSGSDTILVLDDD